MILGMDKYSLYRIAFYWFVSNALPIATLLRIPSLCHMVKASQNIKSPFEIVSILGATNLRRSRMRINTNLTELMG